MNRKDSWTMEDDNLLAEVVLANVRDGKTQLEAFQEAAERLGRTPQACGFRWNSVVRKQYEAQLMEAKQNKKSSKESESTKTINSDPFTTLTIAIEQASQAYNQLQKDYVKLQRQYAKLQRKLEERPHTKDLDTLLQIINNAKELGLLNKESSAS